MNQKHQIIAVMVAAVLVFGLVYIEKHPKEVEGVPIVLTKDGYQPATLSVPVGTTVTFSSEIGKPHWPASNLHPTHEIYSEFDPKRALAPDESWSFTFDKAGDWEFHDHIRAYFTGTITVLEQ